MGLMLANPFGIGIRSITLAAATEPAPTGLPVNAKTALLLPSRQFSSELSLSVFIRVPDGAGVRTRQLGSMPAEKPLMIPACQMWWVRPKSGEDLDSVVREVNHQQIPGLELVSATDADLEAIKGLTSLRELHLARGGAITNAGLQNLNGLTALQWLDLHGVPATDPGLAFLAGLTHLQTLELGGCTKLADGTLQHIKDLTNLQSLNLHGTQITDDGLENLQPLASLRSLNLHGTLVTGGWV